MCGLMFELWSSILHLAFNSLILYAITILSLIYPIDCLTQSYHKYEFEIKTVPLVVTFANQCLTSEIATISVLWSGRGADISGKAHSASAVLAPVVDLTGDAL